jgi:hypothetical protein
MGVQLPQLGATCPEGREAAGINQPSQHTVHRCLGGAQSSNSRVMRRSRRAAECPVEGGGGDEEGGTVIAAGGHCITQRQRGREQRG